MEANDGMLSLKTNLHDAKWNKLWNEVNKYYTTYCLFAITPNPNLFHGAISLLILQSICYIIQHIYELYFSCPSKSLFDCTFEVSCPNIFFHCWHENQYVLPQYNLIFCPKMVTCILKILSPMGRTPAHEIQTGWDSYAHTQFPTKILTNQCIMLMSPPMLRDFPDDCKLRYKFLT